MAFHLARLAERCGYKKSGGYVLPSGLARYDVASLAQVSRTEASRILTTFRRLGYFAAGAGHQIVVADVAGLRELDKAL